MGGAADFVLKMDASPSEKAVALDAELTQLHADNAHAARLSVLHEEAAAMFYDDPAAQRFQLTHAWVFALVDGDDRRVAMLEAKLTTLGGLTRRETPADWTRIR